jgi:hypothetical protein
MNAGDNSGGFIQTGIASAKTIPDLPGRVARVRRPVWEPASDACLNEHNFYQKTITALP